MDDLAIARAATLRPIGEIAAEAGIPAESIEPYGRFKAKVALDFAKATGAAPKGKLVLVTGISPTAAGEGKTTTTIGLGDALAFMGTKTMICLREPSLGPCFGVKGGATGGGKAQVAPMDEINLHFTGDFHAVTSANNLLAAMIDNHIYWGNDQLLDPRRVTWRRCLDMNDRALRHVVNGLGGVRNGSPREDGFDITVASEVMAILCLARDLRDLQYRLGRIQVGTRRNGGAVSASDIAADGAMAVLLREAFKPNLVQTLEGTPALVHGGPFANIAHGCNSVTATRLALGLADVVVTEAGFGADLGGEKFLDIKCRIAELAPSCVVIVATARALKMHGGVAKDDLSAEDPAAVARGVANLERHVENMQKFGIPVIVAVNRFTSDTEAELAVIRDAMATQGVETAICTHWADGALGAGELAWAVQSKLDEGAAEYRPLYPLDMGLLDKIRTVAREIYRASDVSVPPEVAKKLAAYTEAGFGGLPVCIAKTQYSFSADPALLGAPDNHVLPVRDVRLSAGAGFVVVECGAIMTMPGLPRDPAAHRIYLGLDGMIEGLS